MAVATPLPTGGGSAPLATATPIAQGTAASTAPAAVSPGGETSGQGAALPKATATPVSAGAEAGAENGGVEGAVSTTTNRPKKKKGVDKTSLTVMAVAAVVLLLAAGGYVLFGRGGGDDDDKVAKTPPAKKSPTTTPHDRPEDRPTQDNKPDQQAPGDGGPSPGPDEGSPTGIPTPEPPPVDPPSLDPPGDDPPGMKKPPETEPPTSDPPSTEPPTTQPPTTQPPSDQPPLPKPELAAVDSALKEARDALSRRNLGSARIKILQARRAAEHPYLVAKVRRTQRLQINVNKFWTAVREGLAKLSTGEVLKINNTEFTVESKDVERMQLTVKVAGAVEKTYELRDMSFELAQLLADKVLNPTDPMTKVLKGSVLLVDHRSETPKESARQMFAEAERAGAIVDMMTAVVDDTYDPTGQSGVDPSMIRPDEPTMTDPPSPKPDATELAKLEKALKAAKKAMATRDFPTARDELASAAEAAQLPEHKALLARLKEVYDLKLQAWKSVQVGLTKMKALEIIMIEGLEIPIVETDAQNLTVTVRAPGQNKKYGLPTMDHRLAFYAMDRARAAQFPETKMMKGALLAFDVHTARKFDANSLARGFWSDAGDQGEDVSGLLKVLEDDYEKVAP